MKVRLVWEQDSRILKELEKKLGACYDGFPVTFLASLDEQDRVLAGVVYSNFEDANCQMSWVINSAYGLRKSFLQVGFAYPFLQLGLRRVTGVIKCSNIKALEVSEKLGFQREVLLRHWYPDDDAVQMVMFKDECKWLPRA